MAAGSDPWPLLRLEPSRTALEQPFLVHSVIPFFALAIYLAYEFFVKLDPENYRENSGKRLDEWTLKLQSRKDILDEFRECQRSRRRIQSPGAVQANIGSGLRSQSKPRASTMKFIKGDSASKASFTRSGNASVQT